MALEIVVPAPAAGASSCLAIQGCLNRLAQELETQLNHIVAILSDPTEAAAYWQIQGSNGVAALNAFAQSRALLALVAPDRVSAALADAGSTLVVNLETGVVTLPE